MTLQMTKIEVRLPDKNRTSTSFATCKPMAELTCVMDNGHAREIVVPARVGRVMMAEPIGLPLDEEAAFDAIHALEGRICFTLMTELLSRRDYAIGELKAKLRSYGYRDEEIDACVERGEGLRYINDGRFASYFIEERKRRGWGRIRIERELKLRGVDFDDTPGYPEDFFSDDDDYERARAILERKATPDSKAYEKLVRHLMAKGFTYAIAARATRNRLDGQE